MTLNKCLRTMFVLTALTGVLAAEAVVLVNRPPGLQGGSTYSDFGPPRQFVATRYRLPGANGYADITKITLWANWEFQPVTFAYQSFVVYNLSDVNGAPSSPAWGGGFSQFGQDLQQQNFLHKYTINLGSPLRINLGQFYWLHFSGTVGFNFSNHMSWTLAGDVPGALSLVSTTNYLNGYTSTAQANNQAFQLEGTVTITGPSVIAGHIGLQGLASPGGATATIDIIQDDVVVETQNVGLAADGSFSTTTNRTGLATLRIHAPHFLTKRTASLLLGYDTTQINEGLINGDIDGDNEVGVGDYSILSANYNLEVALGDLNEDGVVDIADYSILSSNFGLLGDD